MNRTLSLIDLAVLLAAPAAAEMKTLNGAGAPFPYPIYSKWFDEYHKVKPDLQINYQSIGSGGGIRQVTEHTVVFGAPDGPMTSQQQFKVDGKILLLPTVLGAVVPAYNLKGVEDLKLSGPVIADIFLGKITKWNAARIAKLNPDAALPDERIPIVHRSDGSGTTYCWVDYLAKVSPEWKSKVGVATAVKWPLGLGGKGNEGVAGLVKQTPNALGYVELIYAKQNDIAYASVLNKAGKFVKASIPSVTAAAAGVKMPKDFKVSITDAEGEASYPVSTFTWLLVYEKNAGDKGAVLKDFLKWMLKDGQPMASALGYAPLPDSVNSMVAKAIEAVK